jgi:hypothetical protein
MARLKKMPPVEIDTAELAAFGADWAASGNKLERKKSMELGRLFDRAVANSLAVMLGDIPIATPNAKSLVPAQSDCVELGDVRIIGGIRPQNFDVGYRPDGVRFAYDTKTLNDRKSIKKNWQNMINDLATEATTVHGRFPHAVVAFMVIYPGPSVAPPQRDATIETLERLARRTLVEDPLYMAEVISLVFWNPEDGSLDPTTPNNESPLRIERFSEQVEAAYVTRYKGLPPHTV